MSLKRRVGVFKNTLQISLNKARGRKVVHFIHVGKTAGTAIRKAFDGRINTLGNYCFIMQGHDFRFKHVKEGENVFFVVREPVERYVSGFYSRLREGKPRINNPWKENEAKAFANYKTPNQLAEELYSEVIERKSQAEFAMHNIGHVNDSYWDWFHDKLYLKNNACKIIAVLNQRRLKYDFDSFTKSLGISNLTLPEDDISAHKNPEHFDKKLSNLAISNLKKWYSKEYEFIEQLRELGKLD